MRPSVLCGLFVSISLLVGCGSETTSLFGFVCASCTNVEGVITNLGPTASEEDCQAWGAENQCASADLLRPGTCGDDIQTRATCVVAACRANPSAGCPDSE